MRGRSLSILRSIVLVAILVGVCGPRSAAAQTDAARFADALAARETSTSLAGPMSGELTQTVGFVTFENAGVNTESFSASVTFINPTNQGTAPWDLGIAFHRTADAAQQFIVDSTGAWYYAPWPTGALASGKVPFDASPGGTNTFDLVVDGDFALFGVNGEFVTSAQLPPPVASGTSGRSLWWAAVMLPPW